MPFANDPLELVGQIQYNAALLPKLQTPKLWLKCVTSSRDCCDFIRSVVFVP